jgi:hypothetical protein
MTFFQEKSMSYQNDLQDDLIHARHEAGHALHAHLVGHVVQRVVVGSAVGHTDIVQPITPENLEDKWGQSPLLTSLELCRALGTLRAGFLCELACRDISGPDAAALALWQQAYVRHVGTNSDWTRLYAAVFERLTAWHRHTSVRSAVSHLGEMLLRQGNASRQAWLSMCEVAMVDALVPEPRYEPVLPSPTHPRSSQASSPSVPRRADLQVVPARAAQDADELILEDGQYRYFAIDNIGEVNLYRRVNKSTRSISFLVVQRVGEDREGKPVVRGSQHTAESDARRAMVRLAG